MGAEIPALFTIKDAPDRFCWIRQFQGMDQRSTFLPSFYGGDVWKEFGDEANEMMLEWHHVHLVKPEGDHQPSFEDKKGIWTMDFYTAHEGHHADLVAFFSNQYIPHLKTRGISNTSLWVSELIPNDFARLPVYQERDLLLVMTAFNSEEQKNSVFVNPGNNTLQPAIDKLTLKKKSLELYPV
jgi:hypothetical protein